MDKELLIYLAIGAFYLFRTLTKKKSPKSGQQGQPSTVNRPSKTGPKTLEDLLKEFTEETAPETTASQERKRFEEEIDDEFISPTASTNENEKTVEWEQVVDRRNKYQIALDEGQVNLNQPNKEKRIVDSHFKAFALTKKKAESAKAIRKKLSSPKGFKEAIVLNEIIKTKF